MKKSILNLAGAQELSKGAQKEVAGGRIPDVTGLCGAKVYYTMTKSQCLSQINHNPIWIPETGGCSLVNWDC